jgi:hypothetical protein
MRILDFDADVYYPLMATNPASPTLLVSRLFAISRVQRFANIGPQVKVKVKTKQVVTC